MAINQTSVDDYYRGALGDLQRELIGEGEALLNLDTAEYAQHLVSRFELQPFSLHEEDSEQEGGREFREETDIFDRRVRREIDVLTIEIPCDPHPRNPVLRNLRGNEWRPYNTWNWEYDARRHLFRLNWAADANEINRQIEDLRWRVERLNRDVAAANIRFATEVTRAIEQRKSELSERGSKVDIAISQIDLPLRRRMNPGAGNIDLSVRQAIQVLRPKPVPRSEPEYSLLPTVVQSVVDQVAGFFLVWERTPRTYAKLDEEELRDNLLALLNAIFDSGINTATGETFSKHGKTDIYLALPEVGKSVLVFECKWWSGAQAYGEAIDQLFGYLPWRQTFAVLVTFVGTKGFGDLIDRAKQAATSHSSFVASSLTSRGESGFVTRHMHPEDEGRQVEVHHLLVHLPKD